MIWNEKLDEKPTKEFGEAVVERRNVGGKIISMGLGEPDLETPSYIVDAMFEAIKEGYTKYSAAQGLLELRERIAKDLSARVEVNYSANEVVVLPGIKAAIYFSLCSILEPEDEVIYCTPCYVSYPTQILLAEPKAKLVPFDLSEGNFEFDLEAFKNKITDKTKVLLMANPNNPTGNIYTKDVIEKIIEICKEKNIYIISDEVYDKLVFSNKELVTFSQYESIKEQLVVVNGYSKSHAMTGWRLGYAVANKELARKMSVLNFNVNTNTTTFIQKAACSIYDHGFDHLVAYNKKLKERMEYFHEQVNQVNGLSGVLPDAGFFYFVNIKETDMTSNEFCAKLVLKTGVAATPGIAFGDNWDDYIRFSLAVPFEVVESAAGLLVDFTEQLKIGDSK
ncbi:pyridoxal phosphate-dependent aminotransferase [Enterococcus sp. CWB-B31]|uniref:pyridoxal phosphate-dependent aminotransferase n=1 Tax=Enterococcus sp. CWB-B31 TaxID=2885159 RepID=UPI001E62537C|nr:aminotransferase class I/II-fold pyridoxal phosphate-dependent enzyme [Enterococcus sp. CWB-B31]MCB5954635.1 aminotransferase class I/II-fold pyridoxal phosphate-dependent enzyme [Enterococcus sp. CWB-B31]